jgi:IclR helix-turn-helix domain
MLKLSRNRFYSVPVVMRTLDVLEYLYRCESPVKTNEISDNLRVPRTTTYRILRTLVHRGYVLQDLDGQFSVNRPGMKFAPNRPDSEGCDFCRVQEFEAEMPKDQIIETIVVLLRGLKCSNGISPQAGNATEAGRSVSSDIRN